MDSVCGSSGSDGSLSEEKKIPEEPKEKSSLEKTENSSKVLGIQHKSTKHQQGRIRRESLDVPQKTPQLPKQPAIKEAKAQSKYLGTSSKEKSEKTELKSKFKVINSPKKEDKPGEWDEWDWQPPEGRADSGNVEAKGDDEWGDWNWDAAEQKDKADDKPVGDDWGEWDWEGGKDESPVESSERSESSSSSSSSEKVEKKKTYPKISAEKRDLRLKKEEKKVLALVPKLIAKMKKEGTESIKLSRQKTGYSHSFTVTKDGMVIAHMHGKDKLIKTGFIIKNKVTIPGEKKALGHGGLNIINRTRSSTGNKMVQAVPKKTAPAATDEKKAFIQEMRGSKHIAQHTYYANRSKTSSSTSQSTTNVVSTSQNEVKKEAFFIEEMNRGDLDAFLQGQQLNDVQKADAMLQMALGVQDMFAKHWVHRDLKPENILVNEDAEGKLTYKVHDFDTVVKTRAKGDSRYQWAGTILYIAPETARQRAHMGEDAIVSADEQQLRASDTYGLGIMFCELISGRNPAIPDRLMAIRNRQASEEAIFDHLSTLTYDQLEAEGLPQATDKLTLSAIERRDQLMRDMVNPDPSKRPPIDYVVNQLKSIKYELEH